MGDRAANEMRRAWRQDPLRQLEVVLSSSDQRLRDEAAFQNARVGTDGREARDRFYFLLVKAFDRYTNAIGDVAGKTVLVVGCSDVGVLPLARYGANVIGIDVADEAVGKLNARIAAEGLSARARAMVMDAENLTLPSQSVDIVACSGVLHHLDVAMAAATFRRVLKPTGRVVMMEPMAWNPPALVYRALTPSMRTEFEHPLVPADMRTLGRHFASVHFEGFALLSFLALPLAFVPALERAKLFLARVLDPIDRLLFRVVPGLRYLAWTTVIVCEQPRPDKKSA
jgi:SAM-dependent methyltransferase